MSHGCARRDSAKLPVEAALAAHASGPPLVLVVDDEAITARTIEAILQSAGFRTACAPDMAGALERIRIEPPDLILLDIGLPDGSGFDLCRLLQADPASSQAPVLFISAHEELSTKVEGFEAGGVDYLTKPVAGAEVLARVRTHLRLRQAGVRVAELQAERVERLAAAQQNLMPRPSDFPEARFQVSLRQVLAAGGDFYDVVPAGEGIVDYLVADASGHDLAASLWTAALKAVAAEYARPAHLPLEVVGAINSALCRFLPSGAFFTLVYARVNRRNGQLSLVNAGHPPALIVRADGHAATLVRQEGDVVGAFSDAVFGTAELAFQPADRLFLYTDGLVETGGSQEDGIRRLAAACSARRTLPLEKVVPAVVDDVTSEGPAQDDMVLMGVDR
ncbi:MAG: SpoIIE family protein phosphatase [bacterium]